MSLAAGALLVALLVAAGWWPSRALLPWLAGGGIATRLSAACACGAALTGLVQVALGLFGVPAGWAAPGVLAALSLLAGARVAVATAPEPLLPRGLAALLLAVGLLGTGAAVGTPFRSDGSKFWAPKARELARVGASEAPTLHDAARLGVHREYPLLVPSLLAPVFAVSPPDATSGPKLVLAALQLALLGLLAATLRRHGARGLVLLAAVGSAPLLVLLDVRESAVSGGYVDGADALFLLGVVACIARLRAGDATRGTAAAAALFGGALLSTKVEGAVELGIVLAACALCRPWRPVLLPLAAGALALAVPTILLRAGVAPDEPGFEPARLLAGDVLAARALPVAAGVARLALEASCLGLLPALLAVQLARPGQAFGRLIAAGAVAFLLLSYLATTMDSQRHMQTSAHRVAWHWLPALTLLAAGAVARPEEAHGG